MLALKEARRLIKKEPEGYDAKRLRKLALALGGDAEFSVRQLFELTPKGFDLALRILSEWQLDRHYAAKLKLYDLSMERSELDQM